MAQIITIMLPSGRTGDEPPPNARDTWKHQSHHRQYFGDAEENAVVGHLSRDDTLDAATN